MEAALFAAQCGGKSVDARPLHGNLRGAYEIIVDYQGDAFRGTYFIGKDDIYALHFFQKKSKHGVETPKRDATLIGNRLAWARRCEEEGR
jgi:phage-related protein